MTAKTIQYIEYPALCSALKATGLPSNTKRDIVAGPSSLLGINNWSLYVTQGWKHILDLMNLGKSNCITGQHLREYIENHRLDIKYSGFIFSNNLPPLTKCTTKSWITKTWKFLCEKNMVIEENIPNLKPQFYKDSHMMEDFLSRGIQEE